MDAPRRRSTARLLADVLVPRFDGPPRLPWPKKKAVGKSMLALQNRNPSRACFCLPLGHLQWRNAAVRRRGSDRAICAYLKQPNAMTQGARRTDHLSSPTACSSTMRSSNACTNGGSTTGAWPRCPVALGVAGTCRLLRSSSWLAFLFIHFRAWRALAGA